MAYDRVCKTLFHPYLSDSVPRIIERAVFLNGVLCEELDLLASTKIIIPQPFKPYAAALQEAGYRVVSDPAQLGGPFDAAFIRWPKNITEAAYYAAVGLSLLKDGGIIYAAAENKVGGGRIVKMLQHLGLEGIGEDSRNKARVAWAAKGALNEAAIAQALQEGAMQPVLEGRYLSQPGIFGWQKIDDGSALMLQHMRESDFKGIEGTGADFGCGYGYLSCEILRERAAAMKTLSCIDADFRAIRACERNITALPAPLPPVRYLWEDLTRAQPSLSGLDWIVMNPPFHEEHKADFDIGRAFIQTAQQTLRMGGTLWMVANAALPYEEILIKNFTSVRKVSETAGFKVYVAKK